MQIAIHRLMAKIDEVIKCKHLLYWSGEQGIELFNSCDLSADEQKSWTTTGKDFSTSWNHTQMSW